MRAGVGDRIAAVATLAAGPPLTWTRPVAHLCSLEAFGMTTTVPLGEPSTMRSEPLPACVDP